MNFLTSFLGGGEEKSSITLYCGLSVGPGVSENNVQLTVARQGLVGNVQVSWTTGIYLPGVANGSLTPPTGSFLMTPADTYVTANFTVSA